MADLYQLLGPDLGHAESTQRADRSRWVEVCVCGHLKTAHGPGNGGDYPYPEVEESTARGKPTRRITRLDGCCGAMRPRWLDQWSDDPATVDGVLVVTRTITVTCPCTTFRPVLRADRPFRFFNQRRPTGADRADPARHPLVVGLRAYRRRLGKLKRAQVSEVGEAWANEEFDRRVQWTARVCSECKTTDDVWPVFVNADDRSELRCPAHR
jgi:hypothetical protein